MFFVVGGGTGGAGFPVRLFFPLGCRDAIHCASDGSREANSPSIGVLP